MTVGQTLRHLGIVERGVGRKEREGEGMSSKQQVKFYCPSDEKEKRLTHSL